MLKAVYFIGTFNTNTLDKFILMLTVDSSQHDGCLFVKLRDSNYPLGEETKKEIECIHKKYVESYANWNVPYKLDKL